MKNTEKKPEFSKATQKIVEMQNLPQHRKVLIGEKLKNIGEELKNLIIKRYPLAPLLSPLGILENLFFKE